MLIRTACFIFLLSNDAGMYLKMMYVLKRKAVLMRYQVLMLDAPAEFYHALRHRFSGMDVNFTMALTVKDAAHLCEDHLFHLIVLKFVDYAVGREFLTAIRRVNYAPVVVLMEPYDIDVARAALQSGADLCLETRWPIELAVDHIMAQFRRHASYSRYDNRPGRDAAAFQVGDVYIDPLRYVVRVKERSVRLRRREFLLLLYFMRNPKIVLSTEQICDRAWGNEGSYANGVSGPIAILRKAIEPNPAHPIYIQTVNSMGYCFTAIHVETCDKYRDFVGAL